MPTAPQAGHDLVLVARDHGNSQTGKIVAAP